MNPCGKILLWLVVGCFGQNAPIITSSFSGEASQTIFDTSADVSVQCNPNHMCVSIDENYFITNRGHPIDMSSILMKEPCEGNRTMDGTLLTLCTGVFGNQDCGLTFDLNQTHVSYVTTLETGNATVDDPNGNRTIYRYNIPFQCTFPLEEILTLESETGDQYGHYIPKIYDVNFIMVLIKEGEGIGRFPVSMFLYEDATWSSIYNSPPVINVTDTIYVRIVLAKSPDNSVIQARQCWATPDANPDNPRRFLLIDDFCAAPVSDPAKDPQVDVQKNGISNYAEWTAKAFKFAQAPNDQVHLHCWARVCFEGEGQPSCNKVPCPNGRKKRSIPSGGIGQETRKGLSIVPLLLL